jgi:hypothetical protein
VDGSDNPHRVAMQRGSLTSSRPASSSTSDNWRTSALLCRVSLLLELQGANIMSTFPREGRHNTRYRNGVARARPPPASAERPDQKTDKAEDFPG